jgi:CobQ/CobB/MinD/ParA nucleotide binding domain
MLGGKGGVGKTTIVRTLYYHLVKSNVNVKGYDTDVENPEFQYYNRNSSHPVAEMDFREFAGGVEFINTICKEQPTVVLLDSSGASSTDMREMFEEFGILEEAQKLGYQVVMLAAINNGHSSLESLKVMVEHCKHQVSYAIVLNNYFQNKGQGFSLWDKSDLRKDIVKNYKYVEIAFPELNQVICQILEGDTKNDRIPFFGYEEWFSEQPGIVLPIRSFLNRSYAFFMEANQFLGLPSPTLVAKK